MPRALAEDINFDVLIGVATAADSTKEELDKTQGATTTGMTSLSSEAVNGLQTLKAALVARGNALKLGSLVRDAMLTSEETRLNYLREDFTGITASAKRELEKIEGRDDA